MKNFFPGLLTIVALFISTTIFAQVTGEYRSSETGDWNVPGPNGTWEQWDGSTWVTEFETGVTPVSPTVEATASGIQSSDVTSHSITLPSGIVAGELLLVVFSADEGTDDNIVVSINTGISGNNWSILGQRREDDVLGAVIWKIAEGGDVLTLTTNQTQQNTHISYRISGGTSFNVYGASADGGNANSANPPSLSPAPGSAPYLWIATASKDGTSIAGNEPTNFSNLLTQAGDSNGASTSTAIRNFTASNQDPGNFTSFSGSNEEWVSFTIAVYSTEPTYTPISYPQGVESFPVVMGVAQSNAGDNVTTHIVSLPNDVEEGDLLIAIMGFRDRSFTATTVSFPAGWTELVTRTATTGQGVVFYKIATPTEAGAASISVSTGSVDARAAYTVYRIQKDTYAGVPEASFMNVTTMVSGANPNPPSLTPSWGSAKNLWIAGAAGTRAGTTPNTSTFVPSGFGSGTYEFDASNSTTSSASVSTATQNFEGSSLDPDNFTLTTTVHRAFTIAIQGKPSGAIATIRDGHEVTVIENVEMFDVSIEAGGELSIEENVTFTIGVGGEMDNNGTISGEGTLDFSGADFTNTGTMSPGFSTGILNITGSFLNAGAIDIEITGAPAGGAGVAFDQLNISGKATINGTINVDFGNYIPLPGYEYQIIFGGTGYEGMPALNVLPAFITASYDAGKLTIVSVVVANIEKIWDRGANTDNWEDPENWLPDGVPGPDDDIWIGYFPDINATVVLSTETEIESMILGSSLKNAQLTIIEDASLTTNGKGQGDDGVHLWENSSSILIVDGDLNVGFEDLDGGDGIDVNEGTTMIVGETGTINIDMIGNDAIEITGKLRNHGVINMGATGQWAINIRTTAPDSAFINYSTGQVLSLDSNNPGMFLASGGALIRFINEEEGTIILTTNVTNNVSGAGLFHNYGTFGGNGRYESAQSFINFSTAVIAPGTSPGTLTLNRNSGTLDLSGLTFNMEIEGNGAPGVDYDQVVITVPTLNIADAILSLSGGYTPVPGDEFVLLTYSGDLDGTFADMGVNEEFFYKGFPFEIDYSIPGEIIMKNLAPLPVELIEFQARALNKDVLLQWSTASELNNDGYDVERSTDGRNWKALAFIAGAGTTLTTQHYNYTDKTVAGISVAYYRLAQKDFDGSINYSPIRVVELGRLNEATVNVFPNPTSENMTITFSKPTSKQGLARLYDQRGRVVSEFVIASETTNFTTPVSKLPSGMYMLEVKAGDQEWTKRVVIK
jgi:hypothetical protein